MGHFQLYQDPIPSSSSYVLNYYNIVTIAIAIVAVTGTMTRIKDHVLSAVSEEEDRGRDPVAHDGDRGGGKVTGEGGGPEGEKGNREGGEERG